MSNFYLTDFTVELFSSNKLCTFYVIKCHTTNKYLVLVSVYPISNKDDNKDYIILSHDDEKEAQKYKNNVVKLLGLGCCS